jgi:DNA repair protein RecO (recombination protein O)
MDGHRIGLYRAQGIVLRQVRLGEADRIVTVYTQAHGRIRAVAKGIRRSTSRFGGRLDAFGNVDLQLYRGRSDLDIVTQAEIIARPRRPREDYAAFCAAPGQGPHRPAPHPPPGPPAWNTAASGGPGPWPAPVERTTPEREPNVRLFLLLRTGLEALEGPGRASVLAYAFLAKLASMAGLHPTLEACVECGGALNAAPAFSHGRGGAVCGTCVEGSDERASREVLEGWANLLREGWEELSSCHLEPRTQRELGALLLRFVQWHTESRLRAFVMLPAAP